MSFQRIGIIAKPAKNSLPTLLELIQLMHQEFSSIELYIERENWQTLCQISQDNNHTLNSKMIADDCCLPMNELLPNLDLMICIGGDGTLINIAQHTPKYDLPVLGINLGRLGYLTDILPHQLRREIYAIMSDEYWIEKRVMIEANISSKSQTYQAINEICVHRSRINGIIDLEVYVNDSFVIRQRSDGLIINTATGSTAYALAAGGSIISPSAKAICVTPISPHTLSYRPLILNDSSEIKIILHKDNDNTAMFTADSLNPIRVNKEEPITIKRSKYYLSLMHTNSYNEFETLRSKLGWG